MDACARLSRSALNQFNLRLFLLRENQRSPCKSEYFFHFFVEVMTAVSKVLPLDFHCLKTIFWSSLQLFELFMLTVDKSELQAMSFIFESELNGTLEISFGGADQVWDVFVGDTCTGESLDECLLDIEAFQQWPKIFEYEKLILKRFFDCCLQFVQREVMKGKVEHQLFLANYLSRMFFEAETLSTKTGPISVISDPYPRINPKMTTLHHHSVIKRLFNNEHGSDTLPTV